MNRSSPRLSGQGGTGILASQATPIESDSKRSLKKSKTSKRSSVKKPTTAQLKAAAAAEAKALAAAALAAGTPKAKNAKMTGKNLEAAASGPSAANGPSAPRISTTATPSSSVQPGRPSGRAEDRETLHFFDGVANMVFNYAERYCLR